jgi:hypothetical protein
MIRSFKDRRTEDFFGGDNIRKFSGFRKAAERKLVILDNAVELATSPPVQEIDWRSCRETGLVNTVSGSTTNGGFVLRGR